MPRQKPFWIAVWTSRYGYALDAYPHEFRRYITELRKHHENFSGPYQSHQEAETVATKGMLAEISPADKLPTPPNAHRQLADVHAVGAAMPKPPTFG